MYFVYLTSFIKVNMHKYNQLHIPWLYEYMLMDLQ